ncbi:UDP-N-acetylglucosamine 2-epimerase [alpha proteobacterium U9-1i]|nr:UDP-N-acetylglucosamine 2-epimerase [alpha proteobacterium U9-1i]
MSDNRITTIVGARPQFVKAAAVSRVLRAEGVAERLIHTGQHHDRAMSDAFFTELEISPPALNLGIANLSHGAMTARMLEALEAALIADRPRAVLVYGDTNSTLAGALASAKLGIPVVHVEAGMRSGRRDVPEEINRIVVDHLSALLLTSSEHARRNLEREGLVERARHVGDVMYDVTLFAGARALEVSGIVERLGLRSGGFQVLTLHRAENVDDPARLAQLLRYVADNADGRRIVFPVHPRTAERLHSSDHALGEVTLTEPLGYFDFHRLLAECASVLTDSGGVQKEAYFHRKPCVTLRDETEWVETIDAGWNRLWTSNSYVRPRRDIDDYGDGHAAERVAAAICDLVKS